MKKHLLSIILLLSSAFAFGQEQLILNYKSDKIEIVNQNRGIKHNRNYTLKLTGINTAHHLFKVDAKSFELYTAIPEGLKPIIPALAGSVRSFDYKDDSVKNDLNTKMSNLYEIKRLADRLHDSTERTPNHAEADAALAAIFPRYGSPVTNDQLMEEIGKDIYTINAVAEMLKAAVVNQRRYDPDLVDFYAISTARADDLKKNNYLSCVSYIIKSTKAKDFNVSKPFKSEKDLTEVKLILIDTYTKDTLYNVTETLYNRGGWGLSFSTGFFYTRLFTDKPYYLEPRADGKMAVKNDKQDAADVSIGGFGHLYWKASTAFRIGPGIGLSVSPFDGKSRYLAGLGVLIGKEKMIGITAGCAWSKVKQLSALVSQDAEGKFLPAGATAVPTFDRLKSGFFIGLTYNLVATRK